MLIERGRTGEILGPEDAVDVFIRPSPLRQETHHLRLRAGLSLAEMVEECRAAFLMRPSFPVYIEISGHAIPADRWERIRVKPGFSVTIIAVPGKSAFRSILSIVVSVAALFLAPYLAGPIIGALAATGAAASAITGLIGAGLTIAGTLALSALFPVSAAASAKSDNTHTLYSIGGSQNATQQYGAVPLISGRHRVSPPYASGQYTEISGDDQYLRMLFCVGYGPLAISDVQLGETPISKFEDCQIEIIPNHLVQAPTLYTLPVYEESVSVLLTAADDWALRTTADKITWISVDISFPNGVYHARSSNGEMVNYTVTVEAQYSVAGANAWVSFAVLTITAASSQALRRSLAVSVPAGKYDVRVKKTSPDNPTVDDTVSETVYWTAVRGRRDATVVNFSKPLTLIALRIKATGQLSGTVDTLNCVAEPLITSWQGGAWVANQKTRNPADYFRNTLQGNANARPVADSLIDLQSLQDWSAFCTANGFTFEYVASEQKSVYDRLTMIAACGRGAVSLRDGRWGVVWDIANSPIVQHFTPRNSSNFSSQRAYADLPHGFRMSFINRKDDSYLNDERVVYDDGYNEANATKFEGMDFPGVTDSDLIWRHGRYHIAQLRLQREVYTLTTDFEHLACTRGDRVRVNHDAVLWGLGAARVKSVSSAPDVVTVDDTFTMQSGKTYSMRFRLADGSSLLRTVTGADGDFSSFALVDTGSLPSRGDLVMFGENTLESVILRVKSITAQKDLSAELELVDDAPAILLADKRSIPPFSTHAPALIDYRAYAPTALFASERIWTTSPPTSVLSLSWQPPNIAKVSGYVVQYAARGTGLWSPVDQTSTAKTDLQGLAAGSYDVRIRAAFDNGQLSAWLLGVVTAKIFATPPTNVTNFVISVSGDMASLGWDAISPETGVAYYELRYSPIPSALVTWQTATILRSPIITSEVQVPPRQGTYLIKAISYSGLQSLTAAVIVSTIDGLTSFNAVDLVDEAAPFPGTKDGTYFDGAALRLDVLGNFFDLPDFFGAGDFFLSGGGYRPSGFYYFANTVDLGDSYTSRVSATIDASGDWSSDDVFGLDDVFSRSDFFGDIGSAWNVTVEISITDDDPAASPTWSDWAPLITGSVSARAYRFRALLESTQADVTPVVSSMEVVVDMPDRVIADNDLVVPPTGLSVTFTPAFKELQGVSIAAQGMQTGDYYAITGKNDGGFHIAFMNAAGATISRTLDYVAKGYGAVI
jgi:hypothetical protein